MLENEVDDLQSELYSSSSCSSKMTDITDKENVQGDLHKDVLDDLIEDAIWELCFEIHKSIKLGFFMNLENEKKKYSEEAKKDIFGQKVGGKVPAYQISCPICKNKSCATKYASHLAKCIGISGRSSSRVANKKLADHLDENDSQSDSSVSSTRKKPKKTHGKKSQKKSKHRGNSSKTSLEINANYEDMTSEIKAFFTQRCGVITKTSKKCMNSHKCSQHADDEKREIRQCYIKDIGEQLTSDGQIDVDTVDTENRTFFPS